MLAAGFDPGIAAAGLAGVRRVPGQDLHVASECIRTKPADSLVQRCDKIWDGLSAFLRKHTPDVLVVEEQATASAGKWVKAGGYNADNSKTHVTVGLAIGCARAYRVPVMVIRRQTILVAVLGPGRGRSAEKHEVQRAVEFLLGVRLAQAQADAAACAIAGAQRWQLEQIKRTG